MRLSVYLSRPMTNARLRVMPGTGRSANGPPTNCAAACARKASRWLGVMAHKPSDTPLVDSHDFTSAIVMFASASWVAVEKICSLYAFLASSTEASSDRLICATCMSLKKLDCPSAIKNLEGSTPVASCPVDAAVEVWLPVIGLDCASS